MSAVTRALKLQLGAGLLAVAGFGVMGSWLSALYGWGLGVINMLLLRQGFRLADRRAADNPKSGMTVLYMSAAIRFILLAVLFGLGLAWLDLDPMPMVLTFVVMQLASVFNLSGKRRLTD